MIIEVIGYQFERRMFGSNPEQLRSLAAWLLEQEVEEIATNSASPLTQAIAMADAHYPQIRTAFENTSAQPRSA